MQPALPAQLVRAGGSGLEGSLQAFAVFLRQHFEQRAVAAAAALAVVGRHSTQVRGAFAGIGYCEGARGDVVADLERDARQVGSDGTQARFARAQCSGLLALALPAAGGLEAAGKGGAQPAEARLQHVVVGTGHHGFHRDVLADFAGHN